MREYQIQLKPGKVPHFKTAVRAFDKDAKIVSVANSSINFSLHTNMEDVDVHTLTSVKKATLIAKEVPAPKVSEHAPITENPCGEISLPYQTYYKMEPSGVDFSVGNNALRRSLVDKMEISEAIAEKSKRFESNIATATNRKEKLELVERYSNFLKFSLDLLEE